MVLLLHSHQNILKSNPLVFRPLRSRSSIRAIKFKSPQTILQN